LVLATLHLPRLRVESFNGEKKVHQSDLHLPYNGRKLVSLSSDDWGRWTDAVAIWPNIEFQNKFYALNGSLPEGVMSWEMATAETQEDIRDFIKLVTHLNSEDGDPKEATIPFEQRVRITPFWTIGGPDVAAMKKMNCFPGELSANCTYLEMLLRRTANFELKRTPFESLNDGSGALGTPFYGRGDLRPLYIEAFEKKVWHPEYHGHSHIDIFKWIQNLQFGNDSSLNICYDLGLVCTSSKNLLRSENTMFESFENQFKWVQAGVQAFSDFWGYESRVHSCPHHVVGPHTVKILTQLGFCGMDTAIPDDTDFSSVHRLRFDPFASDYNWTQSWQTITDKLNNESEVVLAYHAQNTFSTTYSQEEYKDHMTQFTTLIESLRHQYPEVTFVTSSEFHQLKQNSWSKEVWHDSIVIRNYSPKDLTISIPNLKDYFKYSEDWSDGQVGVFDLSTGELIMNTTVGSSITLADGVFQLRKTQ